MGFRELFNIALPADAAKTSDVTNAESSLGTKISTTETTLGSKIDTAETTLGSKIDTAETNVKAKIDATLQTRFGSGNVDLLARLGGVDAALGSINTATTELPGIKSIAEGTKTAVDALPGNIDAAKQEILDMLKAKPEGKWSKLLRRSGNVLVVAGGLALADLVTGGGMNLTNNAVTYLGNRVSELNTWFGEFPWDLPDMPKMPNLMPDGTDKSEGDGAPL